MAIQRPVLCPNLLRELNAELKDPEQKVSNQLMGGIEDILEHGGTMSCVCRLIVLLAREKILYKIFSDDSVDV